MSDYRLPIEHYSTLLADKVTKFSTLLADFTSCQPRVFPSPVEYYRMRAEFRIWHKGDDFYPIMFDSKTKQRIKIETFPVASLLINKMLGRLFALIKNTAILKTHLFQVDFLSTLSEEILVSLIYHKPLTKEWEEHANVLHQQLIKEGFAVNLVGRSHKQKICFNVDYVQERLTIHGTPFYYRQIENSFSQPNAVVNQHMIEWACEMSKHAQGDLLELYCGNGNFTLPLSRYYQKILATEIAKSSVHAALHNIAINKITNVVIARLSDDEFAQALRGERTFNRLQEIELTRYQFNTVFVDPPRCGLSPNTLELVKRYNKIIYISCNPLSLKENLHELMQTHQITALAAFDQFPYTDHLECGVVLEK